MRKLEKIIEKSLFIKLLIFFMLLASFALTWENTLYAVINTVEPVSRMETEVLPFWVDPDGIQTI